MPDARFDDLPASVRDRAARVRLLTLDVDGTLSDGRLWYAADGQESKAFHVLDGQGMKLLRDAGIEVALVTARTSAPVDHRARDLGLRHVFQGAHDKLACVHALADSLGLGLAQVGHCGDDLPDLPVMVHCGLAVAPANAHPWVRSRAHWTTRLRGGHGAVRELCDLLLVAQGHADAILQRYTAAP